MAQQLLTLASLLSAVIFFDPWLLLLLIGGTIPVFFGETRFAMLNYSMLYRYTPERRELDYLRYLGASNESAKEVKIFGLGTNTWRTVLAGSLSVSTPRIGIWPSAGQFTAPC